MQKDRVMMRVLSVLYRRSQVYLTGALAPLGVTAAEYPFMIAALKREGLTQDELSAHVCVDKSATARAVKSLEAKGLMRRVQDEADKRQNKVYLTEAGEQIWPAVQKKLLAFNRELTAGIDGAALDALEAGLLQMEQNALALTGGRGDDTTESV